MLDGVLQVLVWGISLAGILVGVLAWRRGGELSRWAPVVALLGFQQVWGAAVGGVVGVPPPGSPVSVLASVVGGLPVLVALGWGVHAAWTAPGSGLASRSGVQR